MLWPGSDAGVRLTEPDISELRREWERQWGRRRDEEFEWSLASDVAPQLSQLLEDRGPWSGRALDVGCGAGASTVYLADAFDVAVGVDIAFPALQQAAARRPATGSAFATADALRLPFPPESFELVFDRGCLQNLPRAAWPPYFREIERVLIARGTFMLLVSRMTARFPPVLSGRGLRLRWAWYVQRKRGGAQFLTHDFIRRACPASLRIEHLEAFDFVTKKDKVRRFTHAVITKA